MRLISCAPVRRALLVVGLWLLASAPVHAVLPQRFFQDSQTEPIAGLLGAGIGDIAWSGRYLWVATASGLARLDPSQKSGLDDADWATYTELNGIARGGISALDAAGDTVWLATVYDSTITGLGQFKVGSGLSFSHDAGLTWQHLPTEAIFDPAKPEFAKGPTTPINNPCWGLSLEGSTIWAAFFSGSSVRSLDGGLNWERLLPDGADEIIFFDGENRLASDALAARADSLEDAGGQADEIALLRQQIGSLDDQYLMHRTFSVLSYGDTVWVGTSSGIGRSFDNGQTWENLKVRLDDSGDPLPGHIGGNWVVALERQLMADGSSVIWAGTRATDNKRGGINSISFSNDNGATWTLTGVTFAWDFAFTANKVWAGTDNGLFASPDRGMNWERIEVADPSIRDQLHGTFVGLETLGDTLWVGAENGLALSTDEGQTWQIVNGLIKTLSIDTGERIGPSGILDEVNTYAAPNPFAPSDESARIVYSLAGDAQVTIKIYDFASRLVRTLVEDARRNGQMRHAEVWDGRDDEGDPVANGVYLYRIGLAKGKQAFGKVVVLD